MESDNIETELFINEVEKRKAIWDMNSKEYSNMISKQKAWQELTDKFGNSSFSEEINETFCKTLQKKWKRLRENFKKELNKQKKMSSGSGTASKNSSIYFERLLFLESSVSNENTDSNIENTPSDKAFEEEFGNIKKKKTIISPADEEFLRIMEKIMLARVQPESLMEQDGDKLFCSYLYKELQKVPEASQYQTKNKMMDILYRAQTDPAFTQPPSSAVYGSSQNFPSCSTYMHPSPKPEPSPKIESVSPPALSPASSLGPLPASSPEPAPSPEPVPAPSQESSSASSRASSPAPTLEPPPEPETSTEQSPATSPESSPKPDTTDSDC